MIKRWKYRKITPAEVEEMKALRAFGWKYSKIGKKFDLDSHSVRYWVDDEYHEKCIMRAKARKRGSLSEEQKEKRREYIRNYIKSRYNEDPEFRERFLKHSKKWQNKKKENLKSEENG